MYRLLAPYLFSALLLFTIFLRSVLKWFGSEFVDAREILCVLSFGYLVSAPRGVLRDRLRRPRSSHCDALMMIGQERVYARPRPCWPAPECRCELCPRSIT